MSTLKAFMMSLAAPLAGFDSAQYIFYGESFLISMKRFFDQCKLMMKVEDKSSEFLHEKTYNNCHTVYNDSIDGTYNNRNGTG